MFIHGLMWYILSTPSLGITCRRIIEAVRMRFSSFQLPLSGSLLLGDQLLKLLNLPFNSLSRDHTRQCGSFGKVRPSELSTPSLGITPLCSGARQSRDDERAFNSLSRDHLLEGHRRERPSDAFNSLSRDHRARFRDFSALRGVLPRHLFAQMNLKTTIWIYRFAPL